MTDHEVETLVRDTFRSRDSLMDAEGLLPAVRTRRRRRRVLRTTAAGALAVAVLLGTAVCVSRLTTGRTDVAAPPVPAGWRLESSLGLQVAIPGPWAVNDYGCTGTDASTVVRGQANPDACLALEPPTKELAIIEEEVEPAAGARTTTVRGMRVVRTKEVLPDGRHAGSLTVPSYHATVSVRTRSAETTRRILDSVRWGDTDSNGCRTRRPARPAGAVTSGVVVPADPVEIGVCAYQRYKDDVLTSSRKATGDEAQALAGALNRAKPGANPDDGGSCLDHEPPDAEAVLLVRAPEGRTTAVWMHFTGCYDRGLRTVDGQSQVTQSFLEAVMRPLGSGWSFSSDLPQ